MENQTPFQTVKKHEINGKTYEIEAMSFWELTNLPDTILGSLIDSVENGHVNYIKLLRGKTALLLSNQIGCKPEDFKTISAEKGLEIISDWLEVNITENFTRALTEIVGEIKTILKLYNI